MNRLSEQPKKQIMMIDGSSFLYRAFYALSPLTTKEGIPVNAVYGFARMIKKIIDTFQPTYLLVAWDSKGPTVRHTLLTTYKEKRAAVPNDLISQKELIQKMLEQIGICQIAQEGVEADDLLYTAAHRLAPAVERVVIATSDKDLTQMVTDKIVLYDSFKEVIVDRAAVEKRFGIPPERVPLYFGLIGDTSDNIPGVVGVGPKAAQPLAAAYQSMDDMYAHIDAIMPLTLRGKLIVQKEAALLSEKLFLLQEVPLELSLDDCSFDPLHWNKARDLFESLGFTSLIKQMNKPVLQRFTPHYFAERYGVTVVIIISEEMLRDLCAEIRQVGSCALDTETSTWSALGSKLVGISFCCGKGKAYYLPVAHRYDTMLAFEIITAHLAPLFADRALAFFFHNAQYDLRVLASHALPVWRCAFDTMIAAGLGSVDGQRLGLKFLSQQLLHQEMMSYESLMATGVFGSIADVPVEAAADYAAADAHQTWQLVFVLQERLRATEQELLYQTIELPIVGIITKMEWEGILLDVAELNQIGTHVDKQLELLHQQLCDLSGPGSELINFSAPRQVEKLLFETLGLKPLTKTAGGAYSTNQEVLESLAREHPVPALLIRYRELSKLKTTYIDALPGFINPRTNRIHTTFNQVATATGRLSSSDPNMQNIPVEPVDGMSIRSAFKAPAGHLFISADYSQIELRVLAFMAQDKRLLHAFAHDEDVHTATAAALFAVPLEQVTHEQRQLGKRINFSVLYGLTPYGLSRELHIPVRDAKTYIETYFAQYPEVAAWMQQVIERTKEEGYTRTYWGRRRYLPGIYEKNRTLYDLACRVAVNTAVQGTAAEVMKLGMIALDHSAVLQRLDVKLILQIHDELLLTVPVEHASEASREIAMQLEQVVAWNVPLRVTVRTGADWGAVTK